MTPPAGPALPRHRPRGSSREGAAHASACLALGLIAVAAITALASCSPKKHLLRPNLPPETAVFLRGAPVDTVNHRVHIYWFGSDVDGDVVAYRMRFVYPPPAPQDPKWDTLYCAMPGRCTDSLFTLFTGDSAVVTPRFEIASIDNQGAVDLSPAVQTFLLSNSAPTVQITNPLLPSDSTYASITINWDVTDPDGGGPGLHYRLWLDGNEARYDSTTDRTFTVSSDWFLDGTGTFRSGPRTLYIQAVDDGGRVGPPSSTTWYVRAPAPVLDASNRGRLLVIDDVPSTGSSNSSFDAFYQGALSQLPAGTFSVLRLQFNPRIFRSARDFAQTLRQFRAVLWYRGTQTNVSQQLQAYQDSLGAYLESGGRLYLDGLYLLQGLHTPGAFRADFVTRYLGSTGFLLNFSTTLRDSTAGWGNAIGTLFRSSAYADTVTLRALISAPVIQDSTAGVRGFAVSDTNNVALWAMDGQLVPQNIGFEVPVGVTYDSGLGRIVLISLPLRLCAPAPATRLLNQILYSPSRGLLGP